MTAYIDRYDSSAMDAAFREMAAREHEVVRADRAKTFGAYAKYIAPVIVAMGVTAFLVLWGLSLLNEKPDPVVIEKEVVVEKPVAYQPHIYIDGEAFRPPQEVLKEAAKRVENHDHEAIGEGEETRTIYDYVIFKTIEFPDGTAYGFEDVIVAIKFVDSNTQQPEHQECFVQKVTGDEPTAEKITLAIKQGDTQVDFDITEETTNNFGASVDVIHRAHSLCRFM